jgi:hypothetical protein
MSKKMNDESKEQIDESENVMYDDLDECFAAADEFLRTHPNYYDHSSIPPGNLTTTQFIEYWRNRTAKKRNPPKVSEWK